MNAPKWHETTVALPTAGVRDDLSVTPVRFRGTFVQVLDSRDIALPEHQNLLAWLPVFTELSVDWEDAVISYAEPFSGGTASEISLVVTGWRYPNELEQEFLVHLTGGNE